MTINASIETALRIGYGSEKGATKVDFSGIAAACASQYGAGSLSLYYQRPGDAADMAYEVALTDNVWTVSAADAANAGTDGQAQVSWTTTSGDVVKKSRVWTVKVDASMTAEADPPAVYQSYIDQITAKVASVDGVIAAEAERVTAEADRQAAENTRAASETGRADAETTRVESEALRQAAETARASAESARVTAEAARQSAEQTRGQRLDKVEATQAAQATELENHAATLDTQAGILTHHDAELDEHTEALSEHAETLTQQKAEIDSLSTDKLSKPSSGIEVGKYFRVASIDAEGNPVLEACDLPSAPVQDVQVNGTSILSDGVANVPIASADGNTAGVVKAYRNWNGYGVLQNQSGSLYISQASLSQIANRTNIYNPLTSNLVDTAVKAALTDSKRDTTYTDTEKANACDTIGAERGWKTAYDITTTAESTTLLSRVIFDVPVELQAFISVPAATAAGSIVGRFYDQSIKQIASCTLANAINTTARKACIDCLKLADDLMQVSYWNASSWSTQTKGVPFNCSIYGLQIDSSVSFPVGTRLIVLTREV